MVSAGSDATVYVWLLFSYCTCTDRHRIYTCIPLLGFFCVCRDSDYFLGQGIVAFAAAQKKGRLCSTANNIRLAFLCPPPPPREMIINYN